MQLRSYLMRTLLSIEIRVLEIGNLLLISRALSWTHSIRFEFDRVLAPGTAQEVVFEAVQPLIVSVLDGYNVCIFACEFTLCFPLPSPSWRWSNWFWKGSLSLFSGVRLTSWKTYTMEGYGTDIGVSPRAIDEVFNVINGCTEDWSYTVTLSFISDAHITLDYL